MGLLHSREVAEPKHDAKTWAREAQIRRAPPPAVEVPLEKIERAFSAAGAAAGSTARFVVLALGGSFCPLHREHARVLAAARRELERRGEVSCRRAGVLGGRCRESFENRFLSSFLSPSQVVLGGFLVPTSDSYLRRKLGDAEALPLADRVEMCRRALADGPWDVFAHGWANAFSAGEAIARAARARLGVEVVAVPCYGADLAERSHAWATSGEELHVCVGRPGHTAAVRRELARHNADARRRGAPESGLVVVEGELDDVSSTKVRALVRARKWGELERSGDVHAEVVACLRAMPADGALGVGGDDT